MSKYSHKDLLADYRLSHNQSKARVYEYKNSLMEISNTLREINSGKSTWEKYRELKEASISLGKEIAENYDSHKLYLKQIGITKEKLEISIGLRQRPITNVEIIAKETVELYVKSSQEARTLYEKMKSETFNIKNHKDYEAYSQIRDSRNELAGEILSSYPLHREFVNQSSREYFISKKTMESQVAYAEKSSNEQIFFRKLEITKYDKVQNFYDGYTVSDCMELNKKSSFYERNVEIHVKKFGYAPHVSSSMVLAYCHQHSVKDDLHVRGITEHYASMLVQQHINAETASPSMGAIESSIKHALCFEALKEAAKIKGLTPELTHKLHTKASALSDNLTNDDMHVLKNNELVQEAYAVLNPSDTKELPTNNIGRIVELNLKEIALEKIQEQQKTQNLYHSCQLDNDIVCEIGF